MDMFTNFVCKQTHNPQGSAIHKFTAGCELANNLALEEENNPFFLLVGGHFNFALGGGHFNFALTVLYSPIQVESATFEVS